MFVDETLVEETDAEERYPVRLSFVPEAEVYASDGNNP